MTAFSRVDTVSAYSFANIGPFVPLFAKHLLCSVDVYTGVSKRIIRMSEFDDSQGEY